MATKIKRSIYIGLGGTGMLSILHTKKLFVDTYGEVPPMIGFLGIDTDRNQYTKVLESTTGELVMLSKQECLPIHVKDATPYYMAQRDRFSWIPSENISALSSMMLGAGQVRTNGRFAYTINYTEVKNKITNLINLITKASISQNPNYEGSGAKPCVS